jgi:hypothetical protein
MTFAAEEAGQILSQEDNACARATSKAGLSCFTSRFVIR